MKNPDPKISVVVPVFNVEDYLCACIESIINQSFRDLEIILVNDGSTDSSLDICNTFSARDQRITVINQKNTVFMSIHIFLFFQKTVNTFLEKGFTSAPCLSKTKAGITG